jgi:S1-C subfamily serine protease
VKPLTLALAFIASISAARAEHMSLPPDVAKRVARPRRLHLLNRVLGRMHPDAQRNYYSLVHYQGPKGGGSGVVIGSWAGANSGTARALVLTNRHVTEGNHDAQTALSFPDGTQSIGKSKVVAWSRVHDYALLEVELPDTAQIADSLPLASPMLQGERIYSMGAATSMIEHGLHGFVAGGYHAIQEVGQRLADGYVDAATVATGVIHTPGPTWTRLTNGQRTLLHYSDAASAGGVSGGPVFSKEHYLLGLNVSGYRDGQHSELGITPMEYVMYDLGKKYKRGRIGRDSMDLVGDLLSRVYPPDDATAHGGSSAATAPQP